MLTLEQLNKSKQIKLSENFTLYELIRSDDHPELVEYPTDDIIKELSNFCENILQPIREKFGAIRVNSGYRNEELNKKVGGVHNSIHKIYDEGIYRGVAADIRPLKADIIEVYEWASKNLPSLKTIILYRKPTVTGRPFIHLDNRENRAVLQTLEKIDRNRYVAYSK